jgi:hypothetical protein
MRKVKIVAIALALTALNPKTGMVAVFMLQCTSGDQWAARDLFLKTATKIFPNQTAGAGQP